MLGSAADAEDVLQEVWLRWADVVVEEVRDPRAYLVRIDHPALAQPAARPSPGVGRTTSAPGCPSRCSPRPTWPQDVELADSVSTAMLLVLETLPPTERAVFVLREVFDVPYAEIAEAVEKSEPAVRQIASRARAHVEDRRPRASVSAAERDAVIERFRAATETGDLQGLMDVLAPDVVLMTDGGGKVKAALNPIFGRDKVFRFLTAVAPEALELVPVWLNGSPAIQFVVAGHRDGVGTMLVEDGVVTRLFLVRNPDKLGLGGRRGPLSRSCGGTPAVRGGRNPSGHRPRDPAR